MENLKNVAKVKVTYAKSFSKKLSKYSGFSTRNCLVELSDNAKEAIFQNNNGNGYINIGIAQPNFKKGLNLLVSDNGCGMNLEDIEAMFTYGADTFKPFSVNASFGGKNALLHLMGDNNDSYTLIFTKKEGFDAVCAKWDGTDEIVVSVCEDPEILKVLGEHGTIIAVYYSTLTDIDTEDIKKFLPIRFYEIIKSEENPNGITVTVNGETLKGEDPLYTNMPDTENGPLAVDFSEIVCGPHDGKDYEVKVLMRDLTQFVDSFNNPTDGFEPINWDVDSNSNIRIKNTETSGVYVQVGDVIICAAAPVDMFFKRVAHNQMNGLRVLVKIPVGLAKQLQFHYNKSKGFFNLRKEITLNGLCSKMAKEFERLLQNNVNTARKKHEEEARDYKDCKTTNYGGKLKFSVNNGVGLPKTVFAIKDNERGGYIFNPASTLLAASSKNAKQFKNVATPIESMLICFEETLHEVGKFQPSFGQDQHPKSIATSARNQILEEVRRKFEEKFMTMV